MTKRHMESYLHDGYLTQNVVSVALLSCVYMKGVQLR